MSSIVIKTPEEIELMRESGRLLASVFAMLDDFIKPGVSTLAINDKVEDYIVNTLQSRPASKGQYGFQYVLNTSLNEVVCHGVPKADELVKDKDIINVDITLEKNGFIADSSKMYVMPEASPLARKLVKTTYDAMWEGIQQVKPGATLGDIGSAIQHYAESRGYSVVREVGGHGVGIRFHEEPFVSYVTKRGTDMLLVPGMIFTIEPMINMGKDAIVLDKANGWTIRTADGAPSAQWEIMVLVTEDGHEVLAY